MAERRMFSKSIVNSARFLKMPVSTQNLYFHLGMNADDDGVVEGFNVVRMINSNEDDLKLLAAKGFVTVLNEDWITFINDWLVNNDIRADRKKDSIYLPLLIQTIPNVEIKESKVRADVSKKKRNNGGRPPDNQVATNGQLRLGKDSLVEDSVGKNSLVQDSLMNHFDELWDMYPNKYNEEKAFQEYVKLIQEGYKHIDIVIGLKEYICFIYRTDYKEKVYMSLYKWLNKKKFEEEYPYFEKKLTEEDYERIKREASWILEE